MRECRLLQDIQDKLAGGLEAAPRSGKLDLRLWLRMLTCSNLVEAEVRARMRSQFSITLPQFDLMAQLDRAPREGLTMGELGNRMMVSAGNITGITDRLERDGHVVRVRSNSDRRSQNVQLTDSGRRFFSRVAKAHEGWIVTLFGEMPGPAKLELYECLATLKQTVLKQKGRDDGDG